MLSPSIFIYINKSDGQFRFFTVIREAATIRCTRFLISTLACPDYRHNTLTLGPKIDWLVKIESIAFINLKKDPYCI